MKMSYSVSARMATFPPRLDGLRRSIVHYLDLFPKIYICLNQMKSIPEFLRGDERIAPIIPDIDLKAAGKFLVPASHDELVFLVDDDIIYPSNYVEKMKNHLLQMGDTVVVGVHGIIYRFDKFDTLKGDTIDYKAYNLSYRAVDCLGTGTVCTWGRNLPSLDYVATANRFVDPRYARFCTDRSIDQVAIPRPSNWLKSSGNSAEGLWKTFGSKQPRERVDELLQLMKERETYKPDKSRLDRANRNAAVYRLECLGHSLGDVLRSLPYRLTRPVYRLIAE